MLRQVPDRLVYRPPRKKDFPLRAPNWRDGLRNVLSLVESRKFTDDPIVLVKSEKYVCTYDMFPKAKYHLLLMRRKNEQHLGDLGRVSTLNDLEPANLRELREFHSLGRSIASQLKECHDNERSKDDVPITMKLGYHAIPSFEPLHLHIISSDLDSPCITKRDHIVSFASPFFVEAESLERHLECAFADSLTVSVRKKRAQSFKRSALMTCPRCGREAASVPDWKRHNHMCDSSPSKQGTGKLNSLLGWIRKEGSGEGSGSTLADSVDSRKRRAIQESGDAKKPKAAASVAGALPIKQEDEDN